jgi:hypothetical protein
MKMSAYFHELRTDYEAEIDDLRTDSEGRNVLDRRLAQKRDALKSLMPMMMTHPVMIAPVFHRAFVFEGTHRDVIASVLDAEPGDFPPWAMLESQIGVAGWARPLIELVLAQDGGEDFLATAVGLEYTMYASHAGADALVAHDDERDRAEGDKGAGDDEGDGEEGLGEDFLEQQGFDRRTPQ